MLQFDKRATAAEVYDAQMRLQMVQECDAPDTLQNYCTWTNEANKAFSDKLKEQTKELVQRYKVSQEEVMRAATPFALPVSENVEFVETKETKESNNESV